MSLARLPNSGMLGRGVLYFDPFTAGTLNKTGEFHMGNCPAFNLAVADELKKLKGSMTGFAVDIESAHISRGLTAKITLTDFTKENLALATGGSAGTLAQTGATVTDESVTASAIQGRWYPCLKRTLTNVSVKAGTLGAETAKTLTTDYLLDAATGRIGIVEGGGIAAGNSVLVTYTYATQTLQTVAGGASTDIYGYLRFIGDPPTGPKYDVEIWRCQITPDGEVGMISDDFATFNVTVTILDDSARHPTEPYMRIIQKS